MPTKPPEGFLFVPGAAAYLGCAPITIRRLIKQGKLPFSRPVKQLLIPVSALDALLQAGVRN